MAGIAVQADFEPVPIFELGHTHFLDGTAVEGIAEAGVMDDTAVADINAMMAVPAAWRYQMGAEGQILVHGSLRVLVPPRSFAAS